MRPMAITQSADVVLTNKEKKMKLHSIVALSLVLVACSSAAAKKDPGPDLTNPAAPGNQNGSTPGDEPGDPGTPTSDGGTSTPTPATDSGPHAPSNQAECVSACEVKYPKAASLNKQLDATCYFGGSCEPVCNNVPPGPNFPPTNDADAAAPVACPEQFAEGVDPIKTPSAACSTCLANTPSCCKLWVDIFGSAEGRDLNKCAVACFSTFKN